jgi:1-phosphofructokinase family hexose kinase
VAQDVPSRDGPAEQEAPARTLVVTVTPNPSLDLLFTTERLAWDDANRMPDPRRRAGGQGINVTRAALALGAHSEAIALLGGRTGEELSAMLESERTPLRAVSAAAETRTFVAVRESATGRSLLLNARGPARDAADVDALAAATEGALAELRPDWLACCGSLPAGFPLDFYARLAGVARAAGCRVVVDCDGEPLRLAAEAGCDLLVPNQHEAARLAGRDVPDAAAAAEAARVLAARGTPLVAVTLGAEGAVFVAGTSAVTARAPALDDGSAVGAGDAFLAGLLLALRDGVGQGDALRRAVAAGSATLLSSGNELVTATEVGRLLRAIAVSPA